MKKLQLLYVASCLGLMPWAQAVNVVVTDTSLTSGSNAIELPTLGGNTAITATNATSASTLVGLDGFASIQNYSALNGNNLSTSDAYIFAFSDETRPDIRISLTADSGSIPADSVYINNSSFRSSEGGSFRVASNTSSSATYRIDLGSYDSDSDTFTLGGGTQALGFTLTGRYPNTDATGGVTIAYYDASDSLLSTQVLDSTESRVGYTGYQSAGSAIAYVEISFTAETLNAPLWGLDDLGTQSIPEISAFSIWGGMAALIACLYYRRRRAVSGSGK